MSDKICPNNYQGDREHQWGWVSVTSFMGGRSGTYARCHFCKAEDWAVLEQRKSQMDAPVFKSGDAVTYHEETWRYDITGNIKLDLLKAIDYEAIVTGDFVSTFCRPFNEPLERWYSIICKGNDGLFERHAPANLLVPSSHTGTIADWQKLFPPIAPKPYVLADDDPALVTPRLRCIGITFDESRYGKSRCAKCSQMVDIIGFVRDSWHRAYVYRDLPSWRELVEEYQRNPWNSSGTGWCVACCHTLLPKMSKAYLKFKLTGEFPMVVKPKFECGDCHEPLNGKYYSRNIGEDAWEFYCHPCRYKTHSHDLYEGGFGCTLGSSSAYIGTIEASESISLSK